jgi:hypothetical protein
MIMMNFRLLKKQAKDKQAIKIDAVAGEQRKSRLLLHQFHVGAFSIKKASNGNPTLLVQCLY